MLCLLNIKRYNPVYFTVNPKLQVISHTVARYTCLSAKCQVSPLKRYNAQLCATRTHLCITLDCSLRIFLIYNSKVDGIVYAKKNHTKFLRGIFAPNKLIFYNLHSFNTLLSFSHFLSFPTPPLITKQRIEEKPPLERRSLPNKKCEIGGGI